jgi:hypothetical protein
MPLINFQQIQLKNNFTLFSIECLKILDLTAQYIQLDWVVRTDNNPNQLANNLKLNLMINFLSLVHKPFELNLYFSKFCVYVFLSNLTWVSYTLLPLAAIDSLTPKSHWLLYSHTLRCIQSKFTFEFLSSS